MTPLLTILIPTVIGREHSFRSLIQFLTMQIIDGGYEQEVEISHICDNKELTIGEKREMLYKKANGVYSLQIDDDDSLAIAGVQKILQAIDLGNNVPAITYQEKCIINGMYYSSNHSIQYSKWADNQDGYNYVRTPFYKDVIRTDIAKSVPFEHIRWNEDERWSYAIMPHLTGEIHLNEEIYHYIHNSTDPTERYGLDK